MKKILAVLLAAVMMFSFVACGGTNSSSPDTHNKPDTEKPDTEKPNTEKPNTEKPNAEAVLGKISNDFDDVTAQLIKKMTEAFSAVGSTYDDYQKNKGLIDEWVELVLSESDALFARTRENSIAYFKLIAADENHKNTEFCDKALDKYYDTVYDDAMDKYYDTLCDDAMDALYDQYYDGIIDDAFDNIDFREWSNASGECYDTWLNASSAIYEKWLNECSYIDSLRYAMYSAFCWEDNFDVDAIVEECEKEKTDEDNKAAEPTHSGNATEGIRPEFKEAMDIYEAFYDEYCTFMKQLGDDPNDLTWIGRYTEMLTKLTEMDEKFEAWDSEDLSDAELIYYLEVNSRIIAKLLQVNG